jgi:hypothetical protein
MAQQEAWSLLSTFALYVVDLTPSQWQRFVLIAAGWILTTGRHAITQALVETDVAGKLHHEAFHRLFSRGVWSPDKLGHVLFVALRRTFGGRLALVIDDTLARKKGPHVFGIANHLDPVTSTRKHRNFIFGHCWVVLSLRLQPSFSHRTWALPLLFRLYRPASIRERGEEPSDSKSRLARAMLDVFLGWVGDEPVALALDNAYCNRSVMKDLPCHVTVEGALKSNSVLYAPVVPRRPDRKGRPIRRGERLGTVKELVNAEGIRWRWLSVSLDGKQSAMRVKTFHAMWPHVCPNRVLRVVLVECPRGDRRYRIFFSTDREKSAAQVLEDYSGRWSTEVTFHDSKQQLGLDESSARKQAAVERMAPFVGLVFSTLVLWYEEHAKQSPFAVLPVRPWYRHKKGTSFEDILRTARRSLSRVEIAEMLGFALSSEEFETPPRNPSSHAA